MHDITDIITQAIEQRPGFHALCTEEAAAIDTYYGDTTALMARVHPFSHKEEPGKLKWRRAATIEHYENFVDEIAHAYTEQVYRSSDIARTTPSVDIDTYLSERYADYWATEVAPLALVVPELYVYLDMPAIGDAPLSQYDQSSAKHWARPSIVLGSSVTNVCDDADGNLLWVSRKMRTLVDGREVEWFEIRDATHIHCVDETGKPVPMLSDGSSSGPHGMDSIPVVRLRWRTNRASGGCVGMAHMRAIVTLNLAQLQVKSMRVEAGYMHLSYKLVADADTLAKIKEQGGIGNTNIIAELETEPGITRAETRYLTTPIDVMEELRRWETEDLPQQMYRIARLRDRSAKQTMNTSGISKAFDMVPELGAVASVAGWLRAADHATVTKIAASAGIAPDSVVVAYPSTFDVQSSSDIANDMLPIAKAMYEGHVPMSSTALREQVLAYFRAVLADPSDETMAAIERELEAAALAMNEGEEEGASDERYITAIDNDRQDIKIKRNGGLKPLKE